MTYQSLSRKQAKFIRSLWLKKNRQQAKAFVVEGAKNVCALLASHYTVQIVVGTPSFLQADHQLKLSAIETVVQTDQITLASLGMLTTNNTVLAVARIPTYALTAPTNKTWGLVLDGIRDPGNMGTIIRLADWYSIPALICSSDTVDLYNPKVIQASMGSFIHIPVYYTYLPAWLQCAAWPIIGTFLEGNNIHHTRLPLPGLIVIGNESHGISSAVLPYIQHKVSIPRYGYAASLNAAMATAIVCDYWRKPHS